MTNSAYLGGGRLPFRVQLLVLATVFVAGMAFYPGLSELYHRWSTQEEYSHGFLIPLISIWLLWSRREAILANIEEPAWSGIPVILIAIFLGIVGNLSAVFLLSQVGFVLALVGIVLAIGGYSLLRTTIVPIAFLLFAIPLPYFVDAILTLRLQLISSELGVFFIRLFGIPVYLDGNIIDMGTYKLQVVEACSGLRYLYPLLSLSFLAAYLFHAPLWQRAVIFLSSIPIAIGMNGFRIGLVGFLVNRWGNQMAEGFQHAFEGWVIFLACAMLLTAEMYVFARLSGKRLSDLFYSPKMAERVQSSAAPSVIRLRPIMSALIVLCVGGVITYVGSQRSEPIQARTPFAEFPNRVGSWQGRTLTLDAVTADYLKFDDYILSDYAMTDGKPVNLYVAYYASQRGNESPHSPVVCIPGSGWVITDIKTSTFNGLGQSEPFNRVVIQKGTVKQIVYYWFDERGRKITDEWWAKYYLLLDAMMMNRTDGALVRLTTLVAPSETEADADRRLQSFMRDTLPQLARFLPGGNDAGTKSASRGPLKTQS